MVPLCTGITTETVHAEMFSSFVKCQTENQSQSKTVTNSSQRSGKLRFNVEYMTPTALHSMLPLPAHKRNLKKSESVLLERVFRFSHEDFAFLSNVDLGEQSEASSSLTGVRHPA